MCSTCFNTLLSSDITCLGPALGFKTKTSANETEKQLLTNKYYIHFWNKPEVLPVLTYILHYFYVSTEKGIWQAKQKNNFLPGATLLQTRQCTVNHINQIGDHNCTEKSLTSLLYCFPKALHPKFISTKAEIMYQHYTFKATYTAFKKIKIASSLTNSTL